MEETPPGILGELNEAGARQLIADGKMHLLSDYLHLYPAGSLSSRVEHKLYVSGYGFRVFNCSHVFSTEHLPPPA